jgi:exodeoxyribonuclease VII small subunit
MPRAKNTLDDSSTFEQALSQLEDLIDRIESGEVGLEQSIADYEKGAKLLQRCRAILDSAEKRIAELTPTDTGLVADAEMDEDA